MAPSLASNLSFGDTAALGDVFLRGPPQHHGLRTCQAIVGGDEPTRLGIGPDPELCRYQVQEVATFHNGHPEKLGPARTGCGSMPRP
jgi:hypothetical protein